QKPLEDLRKFHTYVKHPIYMGEAFALAMHVETFEKLAKYTDGTTEYQIMTPSYILPSFYQFLIDNQYWPSSCVDTLNKKDKITVAGKNFQGFDKRFIDKLSNPWG